MRAYALWAYHHNDGLLPLSALSQSRGVRAWFRSHAPQLLGDHVAMTALMRDALAGGSPSRALGGSDGMSLRLTPAPSPLPGVRESRGREGHWSSCIRTLRRDSGSRAGGERPSAPAGGNASGCTTVAHLFMCMCISSFYKAPVWHAALPWLTCCNDMVAAGLKDEVHGPSHNTLIRLPANAT